MPATIQKIPSPAIPQATVEYSRAYQDQLNNVHRLFYNRLTGSYNGLLGTDNGGSALYFPYGAFSDSTSQSAASTTVAYPITFNTTDYSSGVSIISGTKLTVAKAGVYNIQFSIQFTNTDTIAHDTDVWFRVNGVDVANSNSRFGVPNTHGGVNGHNIAALNFFVQLGATEYVEIMWCTNSTAVSILAEAAGVSPTRPAIPSVIATVSFVSAV